MSWREAAACRGMGSAVFIHQSTYPNYKQARQVCQQCPVRRDCLDFALTIPAEDDVFGMFGGTTPSQRKSMTRRPRLCVECGGVLPNTTGGRIVCSQACKQARWRKNRSSSWRGQRGHTTTKRIRLEERV